MKTGILYTKIPDQFPCFACIEDSTKKQKHQIMTKMGINTKQAKQNILNELLIANSKSRLDKSPTVKPNVNYNKSHMHLIYLTKKPPPILKREV